MAILLFKISCLLYSFGHYKVCQTESNLAEM